MPQHRWTRGSAAAAKRPETWRGSASPADPAPSPSADPIARLHTQVAHLARAVHQVSHASGSSPGRRESRAARPPHRLAAAPTSPGQPAVTPRRHHNAIRATRGFELNGSAGSPPRRGAGGAGVTAPGLTADNLSHASRNELLHRRLSLLSLVETGEERGAPRAGSATDPASDVRRRRRRRPQQGASAGPARPTSVSRALNEHYRRREQRDARLAEEQPSPAGAAFPPPPRGQHQPLAPWPAQPTAYGPPTLTAPARGKHGAADAAWRARITAAVASLQQQVADMTAVLSDHRARVARLERGQLRPAPSPGPHTSRGSQLQGSPPAPSPRNASHTGGASRSAASPCRWPVRRAESMPTARPRHRQQQHQQQCGPLTLDGAEPGNVSTLWAAVHPRVDADGSGGWEELPGGFTHVSPSAPLDSRRARRLTQPRKPSPAPLLGDAPVPSKDATPGGSGSLPVVVSPSAAQQCQEGRAPSPPPPPPGPKSPETAPRGRSPASPRGDSVDAGAAGGGVVTAEPAAPALPAEGSDGRGPPGIPPWPNHRGPTARDRRHSSASLLPGDAPASPLARARAESGEGALVRGASPELRTALLRRHSRMSGSMDSADQSDTPGEALLPPTVTAGDLSAEDVEEGGGEGAPAAASGEGAAAAACIRRGEVAERSSRELGVGARGGPTDGGGGAGSGRNGSHAATPPAVGSPQPSPVPFSTTEDSEDEEGGGEGEREGWIRAEGPPPTSHGDAAAGSADHAPAHSGRGPEMIDTVPAVRGRERRSGIAAAPPTPAADAAEDGAKGGRRGSKGSAFFIGADPFAASDGFSEPTTSESGGGVLLGPARGAAAGEAAQSHSSEPDTGNASSTSRSKRNSSSRRRRSPHRRGRSLRRRRRASTSELFFV